MFFPWARYVRDQRRGGEPMEGQNLQNLPKTFRKPSENIPKPSKTFQKSSKNLPKTVRKPSENLPKPSKNRKPSKTFQNLQKTSENLPKTFRKPSKNFPKTCQKHAKNLPKTFQKPSKNLSKNHIGALTVGVLKHAVVSPQSLGAGGLGSFVPGRRVVERSAE